MSFKMDHSVIFGTFQLGEYEQSTRDEIFRILEENSIKQLDSAAVYPGSERALGDMLAVKEFQINTKAPGFTPGCLSRENLVRSLESSLQSLGTTQIPVYFLHGPDPITPISDTIETLQKLYEEKRFEQLGLSNFSSRQVEAFHSFARSQGYITPTVYQRSYNLVDREAEEELIPLLRKLGMSFSAYSPLAGGLLSKTYAEHTSAEPGSGGRFDPATAVGKVYQDKYQSPTLQPFLLAWDDLSQETAIPKSELAIRWLYFHSALNPSQYGDSIIIGASKPQHLRVSMKALASGPLERSVIAKINLIRAFTQ